MRTRLNPNSPKSGTTIQSVERALDIIEILDQHPQGLGLIELSHLAHLKPSTCHHLLGTLSKRGWVAKDAERKRYRLGLRLLQLKNSLADQLDILSIARPHLERLNELTKEAVHLACMEGYDFITLAKLESRQVVRVDNGYVGKSNAAHCTASGKAILAFLPEIEIDRLVEQRGLKKFTERTITELPELKIDLARIRTRGYAIDDEEFQPDVVCIGAPIFNFDGSVAASISVSVPTMRATPSWLEKVTDMLLQTTAQISEELGYCEDESRAVQ